MNNTSYADESVEDLLSAYIAEKFADEQRHTSKSKAKPKARKNKFYSDNVEVLSENDIMNFDGTVIILDPASIVDEDVAA